MIKLYRPSFHETSKWNYTMADRLGVWPLLDHYHEPLVSLTSIHQDRAGLARELPGLDLRMPAQLELLGKLRYEAELRELDGRVAGELAATYDNLAFGPGDAEIFYALIRHLKPKRVVEVGAGHSTRFAKAALVKNAAEGAGGRLICIEPYESPWLEQLGVEVIRKPVETLDARFFANLERGDILFIDSSHVVRPQGDVLHLFHRVLPHLGPGVVVHVHDIFTPRDYPLQWLERRWFWTEQYVLEALLVNNDRYEVALAVNHLFHEARQALTEACPVLASRPGKEPGSFWLRVYDPRESSAP
ncbi:MAG: class I SAM-dependent methyltransferase [Solirubrobacteraceae bacterium]